MLKLVFDYLNTNILLLEQNHLRYKPDLISQLPSFLFSMKATFSSKGSRPRDKLIRSEVVYLMH